MLAPAHTVEPGLLDLMARHTPAINRPLVCPCVRWTRRIFTHNGGCPRCVEGLLRS